jgi:hypothetical protein
MVGDGRTTAVLLLLAAVQIGSKILDIASKQSERD